MTTPPHDKIIIGGSLASLLYGHYNDIPVIYVKPRVPLFYEEDEEGNSKEFMWRELAFQLSMAGLMPMSDKAVGLRVEEGNLLKVFTEGAYYASYTFNELVVFDDEKLEGWEGTLEKEDRYRVLDWINDRRSSPHNVTHLQAEDDFVKHVYFYPSKRIPGNWSEKKDILTVSYLTKEQVSHIEYSDIYVKFKVLDMMKGAGIQGKKNGKSIKDPTKSNRLSIKIETEKREIQRVIEEPYSEEELLVNYRDKESKNKNIRKLRKYLDGWQKF